MRRWRSGLTRQPGKAIATGCTEVCNNLSGRTSCSVQNIDASITVYCGFDTTCANPTTALIPILAGDVPYPFPTSDDVYCTAASGAPRVIEVEYAL